MGTAQKEAARHDFVDLAEVLGEIRDDLAATRRELAEVLSAFPAGDTDGHRRYHESVIEWRELRNKMVREGLIKVAQAGALAGAGILVGILWKAFKLSVVQ